MPAAHHAKFILFTRWVGEWCQTQSCLDMVGKAKTLLPLYI